MIGGLRAEERLGASIGRRGRIVVPEHRGTSAIDFHPAHRGADHHDVVRLRFLEVMQAEFGFAPVNAVVALGVGGVEGIRLGVFPVLKLHHPRLVVEPVAIAVLENTVITAARALPRRIVRQHDLARHGLMKLQPSLAGNFLDQGVVDEQRAARTDVGRRAEWRRDQAGQGQAD